MCKEDMSDSVTYPMNGENGKTASYKLNRLSLRNHRLNFQTSGQFWSDPFAGIYGIMKKNRQMSTCNWSDLETLGSQLIMSKNLPRCYIHINS